MDCFDYLSLGTLGLVALVVVLFIVGMGSCQ